MGSADGKFSYYVDSKRNFLEQRQKKIYLLDEVSLWVFAHELGRYISIKHYNDESEERANYEERKLIKSLLNEDNFSLSLSGLLIFTCLK